MWGLRVYGHRGNKSFWGAKLSLAKFYRRRRSSRKVEGVCMMGMEVSSSRCCTPGLAMPGEILEGPPVRPGAARRIALHFLEDARGPASHPCLTRTRHRSPDPCPRDGCGTCRHLLLAPQPLWVVALCPQKAGKSQPELKGCIPSPTKRKPFFSSS